MTVDHQALYQRLLDYELSDPAHVIGFNEHLMRSNGWTRAFALRAIEEYRKFVFLAMVADHQVTPSDQVDQVWHLHLLFSDVYWNDFCPRVLGRPLHHEPTRGGPHERARFQHLYRATLASYRQHFGDPPLDLWPPLDVRFGRDLQMQRGPIRRGFRPWRRLRSWWSVAAGAALLVLVSAAVAWADDGPEGGSIPLETLGQWLLMAATFVIAFVTSYRVLRPLVFRPVRGDVCLPLTNSELAYLAAGPDRVLELSLAELVLKGMIIPDVQSRSLVLQRDRVGPLHGVARSMVDVHRSQARPGSPVVTYAALMKPSQFTLDPLRSSLQRQHLMPMGLAWLLAKFAGAALPLGIVTMALTSALGDALLPKPVLAVLTHPCVLPGVTGMVLALGGSPARTLLGDKVLEHQRLAEDDKADVLRRVALAGPAAMSGGRLDDLRDLINGVNADAASSGGCGC